MPAVTDAPTKKKFLVAKLFPGSGDVGSELEYDPNQASSFVEQGFLLEKSQKAENNAATQLGEVLANMVQKGIIDAVDVVNKGVKAHGLGRPDVSIPAHAYAEGKDNGNFGEWLQMAGMAVSISDPERSRRAQDVLRNKYMTKSNPNFGQDFQQNAAQAQEIFRAQLLSKGMSQHEANDMVSKASAQSETIGSLGGFTVPVQYSTEIIKLSDQYARVMPRCRRYTMTGLQLNVPAIDYSKGGSGASPYLGGMNAAWLQDGQAFPQTNAYTREIIYKANILSGYAVANRTLLADNQVGLQEVLTELMSETIGFYFDYSIINGTGVNQPAGILGAAATINQTRTSPGNGAILTDMANMFGHLHPQGFTSAFWLVSPSAHTTFITMNDASGRVVYQPVFPSQSGGPVTVECPYRVLGLPAIVSQLPASSGTAGDVFLIDPQQMGVALRADLELAVSEHVYFLNNQITYRFLLRGDAQPRLNTYLTLANSDTVSPFVVRI